MLSGEYNPALDGVDGERLLGFEQGLDISDTQTVNHVVKESPEIKEQTAPKDTSLVEDSETEVLTINCREVSRECHLILSLTHVNGAPYLSEPFSFP